MRNFLLTSFALLSLSISGCGDDDVQPPPPVDASLSDAIIQPPDAGSRDAQVDAGESDAGESDAGESDASEGDGGDCVPECAESDACGDDGCGGSCGTCEVGSSCAAGICTTIGGGVCPPAGPFGTAEGQVAGDATFLNCEGEEVTLHSLCSSGPVWIYEFAAWCPPCRSFARNDVSSVNASIEEAGGRGYFIISDTADGSDPDADFCQRTREEYGLEEAGVEVLVDPSGSLQTALGITSNAWNVLLDGDLTIRWKGHYQNGSDVVREIGALSE